MVPYHDTVKSWRKNITTCGTHVNVFGSWKDWVSCNKVVVMDQCYDSYGSYVLQYVINERVLRSYRNIIPAILTVCLGIYYITKETVLAKAVVSVHIWSRITIITNEDHQTCTGDVAMLFLYFVPVRARFRSCIAASRWNAFTQSFPTGGEATGLTSTPGTPGTVNGIFFGKESCYWLLD